MTSPTSGMEPAGWQLSYLAPQERRGLSRVNVTQTTTVTKTELLAANIPCATSAPKKMTRADIIAASIPCFTPESEMTRAEIIKASTPCFTPHSEYKGEAEDTFGNTCQGPLMYIRPFSVKAIENVEGDWEQKFCTDWSIKVPSYGFTTFRKFVNTSSGTAVQTNASKVNSITGKRKRPKSFDSQETSAKRRSAY